MSLLPDVSVVISTFQRREGLARVLDSLIEQRVPSGIRYEVIVVDNNCTDGTRDLIADAVRRHPALIRYAFEPRPGVSHGRNAGIRAARGPIIAFTDDDNVVAPTWVATIVERMREHPEAAGIGGRVLPEWPQATPPSWLDRRHWSPLAILDYGERAFFTSARRPLCLLTANLAVRRDVLVQLGGFSPAFPRCQDHELLLRLWRAGGRILYAPELVTIAPVEPRRLTRQYHRRWHTAHGRYAAAMRLEEATDRTGCLRATPPDVPRLLGSPGYVYADAARHAWRWLGAALRRQGARAAHHEHRIRYLAAYLRRTASLSRGARPPLLDEARAFVAAHLERRASRVSMSTTRMIAAHALIALLIAGSAYDIVTGREHWPFSPYPMFSAVERTRTLDQLVLTAVSDETQPREFRLADPAFIAPFDQCRLNTAMERARSADPDGARLHQMLQDSLARYEAQRRSGAHDGPPIRAVRVYDGHWTLDPDAGNVDTPDRARLLDEVVAPPMGAVALAERTTP